MSSAAVPAKEAPLAVALSYLTSVTIIPSALVPVNAAPETATSEPANAKLYLSPVNVGAVADAEAIPVTTVCASPRVGTEPKNTSRPEPPPLENNFDFSSFSDEEIEAAKRKAAEAFKEDKLKEAREKDFRNFGNKYFGGIADTYKGTKAGDGFWNSLGAAHKNADGSLRWDRIAGTYAAAAIGSRVLSGG